MEANSVIAPRRGPLRTVIDRLRMLGRRADREPTGPGGRPSGGETLAVGAVDFLAHVDAGLRFLYV